VLEAGKPNWNIKAKSRGNLRNFQRLSSVFPAEFRDPTRRYFASLLNEITAP
jgi:hypothetical protein